MAVNGSAALVHARIIGFGPDQFKKVTKLLINPIVKQNYYHPDMLGSWSIKAVLPAIAPHLDYSMLEGINEGTAASDGYLEAIDPATEAGRKAELKEQLLRYCKLDTEAMVEIVRFF